MHATAFRKFGQIENFVFVLDGDKRDSPIAAKVQAQARRDVPVLPGETPELWVWQRLRADTADYAAELGIAPADLSERMIRLDAVFDSASETPSAITKLKLRDLGEALERDAPAICRVVGRRETSQRDSDIQPLARDLEATLLNWRS